MTLEELLASYDWEEAFKYASAPDVRPSLGYEGPVDGFGREDVVEIVASVDGDNDGPAWVGVFKLADGRFAVLRASCDYTGWGCQEGGDSEVAGSLQHLYRWSLTTEERQRLGYADCGHDECFASEDMARDCRASRATDVARE